MSGAVQQTIRVSECIEPLDDSRSFASVGVASVAESSSTVDLTQLA